MGAPPAMAPMEGDEVAGDLSSAGACALLVRDDRRWQHRGRPHQQFQVFHSSGSSHSPPRRPLPSAPRGLSQSRLASPCAPSPVATGQLARGEAQPSSWGCTPPPPLQPLRAHRKRHILGPHLPQPQVLFGSAPGALACGEGGEGDAAAGIGVAVGFASDLAACGGDDSVAALLPKMKRMRLRPSLGQLRLQREAGEVLSLVPEVRVCMQPEQLRATVVVSAGNGYQPSVHLELSFPPQYPHRPPKLTQVAPDEPLPFWRYEGRSLVLPLLAERRWSSAMGVADIVRDLVQGPSLGDAGRWCGAVDVDEASAAAGPAHVGGCFQGPVCGRGFVGCGRLPTPLPRSPALSPDDVEMA